MDGSKAKAVVRTRAAEDFRTLWSGGAWASQRCSRNSNRGHSRKNEGPQFSNPGRTAVALVRGGSVPSTCAARCCAQRVGKVWGRGRRANGLFDRPGPSKSIWVEACVSLFPFHTRFSHRWTDELSTVSVERRPRRWKTYAPSPTPLSRFSS